MILCSGCFDGLHSGHVAYLAAARCLCNPDEWLTVAVAPDSYIRSAKGREPRWSQSDRLLPVAALKMVSCAMAQRTDDVAQVIEDQSPRIFVKGADWRGKLPASVVAACQRVGAAIVFVPTEGTHVADAFEGTPV